MLIPAALLAGITALALVVLAGRHPQDSQEAGPAGERGTPLSRTLAAGPFGLYPGQQDRGVFPGPSGPARTAGPGR